MEKSLAVAPNNHRVRQNTFQQLFLYRRQIFQQLPRVVQTMNSGPQGREQQYTSNRGH
ncbi:hypothetical protein MtrunA17_Chr4g0004011 [Medicago truncatula]|uniref:Uncharacterized protein n=1 Tax=Medicago truncatula TaxID=3880 RepID=A0A396HZ45_MEDTR|nr:hypothetical protein MtrunA17_Chr4g0004011 [Medicago truncatula]